MRGLTAYQYWQTQCQANHAVTCRSWKDLLYAACMKACVVADVLGISRILDIISHEGIL